mgnify:CR=1 FL=1
MYHVSKARQWLEMVLRRVKDIYIYIYIYMRATYIMLSSMRRKSQSDEDKADTAQSDEAEAAYRPMQPCY